MKKRVFSSLILLSLLSISLFANEAEQMFWDEVKNSNDIELLKLYKRKYPNGIFESLADIKINRLNKVDNVDYKKSVIPNWLKGKTDEYKFYGVGKANKHFKGKEYQRSLAIKRAKKELEKKFDKYKISKSKKEEYLKYLSTEEYVNKREKVYILLYIDNENI